MTDEVDLSKCHSAQLEDTIFIVNDLSLSFSSTHLAEFPSFREKFFQGRRIVEFITAIDVSSNNLRSLDKLQQFGKLKCFIADDNMLSENMFDGFSRMEELQILQLNRNCIKNLDEFVFRIKDTFPNLEALSVVGNSCSASLVEEEGRLFVANRLISLLPKLRVFNGMVILKDGGDAMRCGSIVDGSFSNSCRNLANLCILRNDVISEINVVKRGTLSIMRENDDYGIWNPSYAMVGEGRVMLFKDSTCSCLDMVIAIRGYEVKIEDDPKLLSKLQPNIELLCLSSAKKESYHFAVKDRQDAEEWLKALVYESNKVFATDWGDIEMKRTYSIKKTQMLQRKVSQIRLRRALDRTCKINPNEMEFIDVLGSGSFGIVYRARIRNEYLAVKVFHDRNFDTNILNDICTEIEIISKIHHPQIILFMGACLEPLMIVTQLMEGGDLESILMDPSIKLSFLARLYMAREAALGISWLHGLDPMILHRDVKTANFLVDENLHVVVADFGFSEILNRGSCTYDDEGYKGTIYYIAPEILKNAVFNEKSDVYGFSMVLWQILTRQSLHPEFDSDGLKKVLLEKIVFHNYRPEIPDFCPPKYRKLLEDCWDVNREKRPGFCKIVSTLEEIILEEAIPDERSREMWKAWFHGESRVKWGTFMEKVSFLLFSTMEAFEEILLRDLLISIAEERGGLCHGVKYVTCETFGNLVRYYGPLDGVATMERIRGIVLKEWFFSTLSKKQAYNLLCNQALGTFIVRCSRVKKQFVISYLSGHLKVEHKCVERRWMEDERGISYGLNGIEKAYSTMDELIGDQGYLKVPCHGSPFAFIRNGDFVF